MNMNPAKHWCVTCDNPATECECGDTDGWRYDPLTEVWMPGEGDEYWRTE